jgi:hypothetical protein
MRRAHGSKLRGPRPMDWKGVVMHRGRCCAGRSVAATRRCPPRRASLPAGASRATTASPGRPRPSAAPSDLGLVRAQDLSQLRRRRCGCPIPNDRERVASIEPVRRNRVVRAAPRATNHRRPSSYPRLRFA